MSTKAENIFQMLHIYEGKKFIVNMQHSQLLLYIHNTLVAAMVHTIVIVVLIRPGWGRCIFEIEMLTFSGESAGKVMQETAVIHRRCVFAI